MRTILEAEHRVTSGEDAHMKEFMQLSGLEYSDAIAANRACGEVLVSLLSEGLGVWLSGLGGVYLHESFRVVHGVTSEIERRLKLRFRPGKKSIKRLRKTVNDLSKIPSEVLRSLAYRGENRRKDKLKRGRIR